jgi:hypothetical protein
MTAMISTTGARPPTAPVQRRLLLTAMCVGMFPQNLNMFASMLLHAMDGD